MTDGNEDGFGKVGVALSLPIVLLLAVVFGGLRSSDTFKSSDWAESGGGLTDRIPSGPGLYSQHAKLWEDPLKYVGEAETELLRFGAEENEFRARRFRTVLRSVAVKEEPIGDGRTAKIQLVRNPGGLLLLPVLVRGGNSSEAARDRIQTREAVVQALMSRGYRLQYPNRLSYMRIPFRIALGAQRYSDHSLTVPVKYYQYRSSMEDGGVSDNEGYHSVLVFWIDEGQLGRQPLSSVAQIVISTFFNTYATRQDGSQLAALQKLFGSVDATSSPASKPGPPDSPFEPQAAPEAAPDVVREVADLLKTHVDVAIIGPHDSDGLFDMIREDRTWDLNYQLGLANDFAPPEEFARLRAELQERQPFAMQTAYYEHIFRSARIYSTRSTVDRHSMVLAADRTIPSEIRSGGRFTLHDCGLELIHFIGTDVVLAETIKEELQIRRKWPTPDSGHMILVTERDTLYGTLADRPFLDAGVPASRCHVIRYLKGGQEDSDANEVEPLTQLRGQLDQLEQEQMDARDVMSIGVLGSSVDSKVELLKYVRQRFPAAVLFTTELSTGFFGDNAPPEIRNTIVASHFGLSLNPNLNIEASAFESGYQTATFAAALTVLRSPKLHAALGDIADDPWGRRVETARKRVPLRPVLYELGRYMPYQLSLGDRSARSAVNIQPEPPRRWSDKPATWVFLALLVLLLFLTIWLLAQVEKRTERVVSAVLESAKRLLRIGREVATLPTDQASLRRNGMFHFTEVAVLISIIALFLLFASGIISDQRRTGEPINFVDGISVWPSLWLLGLVGAVAFSVLPTTRRRLRREADYIDRHKVPPSALVDDQGQPTALAAVSLKIRTILDRYEKQLRRGDAGKIAAISLVLAVVGSLLIYLMGVNPSAPARGLLAIQTALFVQIIVALILIAFVCQATYSVFAAREACTEILKKNTLYVESIVNQRVRRQLGATDKPVPVWDAEMQKTVVRQANIAMHLTEMIANHTRIVSRPVEHAALFVLLFGLARTSVFDAWENSAPALSLLLVVLLVCIGSSWLIRTNLGRRRSELVTALNRLATSVEVDEGGDGNRETAAKLRTLANAIGSIKGGVFRNIATDPILRAFIYASGALITAANQWLSSNLGR